MRKFKTGAVRDDEDGKLDFEGFFSPLVLERRAEYMNKHRRLKNGKLRASDNWQDGFPYPVTMKSAWRHFMDWWKEHRGIETEAGIEDAICALMFNCEAHLHELIKERQMLGKRSIDGKGGMVK